ncbi:hypothetical protein EBT31_03955 [bacterium]|nr:hypothetical protein [bacterium]
MSETQRPYPKKRDMRVYTDTFQLSEIARMEFALPVWRDPPPFDIEGRTDFLQSVIDQRALVTITVWNRAGSPGEPNLVILDGAQRMHALGATIREGHRYRQSEGPYFDLAQCCWVTEPRPTAFLEFRHFAHLTGLTWLRKSLEESGWYDLYEDARDLITGQKVVACMVESTDELCVRNLNIGVRK